MIFGYLWYPGWKHFFIGIFQLLVTCFDTFYPLTQTSEIVTFTIDKNLNSPIFNPQSYEATIFDYVPLGTEVVQVNATDADVLQEFRSITYSIIDNSDYFSINPTTGWIYTKALLTTDNRNRFNVSNSTWPNCINALISFKLFYYTLCTIFLNITKHDVKT